MRAKLLVLISVFVLLLQCSGTRVMSAPSNVLVVQNENSPTSKRIAAYYMAKRNIASAHLVTIKTVDSSLSTANEQITPKDYVEQIHQPVLEFLSKHSLGNKIQYIVLTKGIPFRMSSDPTGGTSGGLSVDSVLATLGMVDPQMIRLGNSSKPVGNPIINKYWRSKEPFSHAKFGGYLVTRLDGYTEADAKALVDRALAPAPSQRTVLLDVDTNRGLGDSSIQPKAMLNADGTLNGDAHVQYADFNADMIRLSQILSGRSNASLIIDKTDAFVCYANPLSVYVSWGSNDKKYSAEKYHSIKFAARGIAETAVSTSGRTLLKSSGGQSLVADLIAQGAAGAKCYVTEPYLFAMASPSVFADFYLSGRNLAESYYAASRVIGWKDIVLGDPLCSL